MTPPALSTERCDFTESIGELFGVAPTGTHVWWYGVATLSRMARSAICGYLVTYGATVWMRSGGRGKSWSRRTCSDALGDASMTSLVSHMDNCYWRAPIVSRMDNL